MGILVARPVRCGPMQKTLKRKLKHFLGGNGGQFALVSAIALPVILVSTGVAWDLSRATAKKTKLQDALDSAVLAAVLAEKEPTPKEFQTLFEANGGQGTIKQYVFKDNGNKKSVKTKVDFELPTTFAGILGRETVPIKVKSSANGPTSLSSFKISLSGASGHWSKRAQIIGVSGGTETILNEARYTTTISGGVVSSSSFTVTDPGWVNVVGFDKVYIRFEIPSSAYRFTDWCKLDGCPERIFRTDEAANADRFFINGSQVPAGTIIKFEDTVQCGETIKHAWEDGGEHNPDFHYTIEGQCDTVDPIDVYLSQ